MTELASDEQLKAADRTKGSKQIVAVSDQRLITYYTDENQVLSFQATPLDQVREVSFYRGEEESTDSEMETWSSVFGISTLLAIFGSVIGLTDSNNLLLATSFVLGIIFLIGTIWAANAAQEPSEPYLSVSVTTDRDESTRSVTIPGADTNVDAALSKVAGTHQTD